MRLVKSLLGLVALGLSVQANAAVKVININLHFPAGSPVTNLVGTASIPYTPGVKTTNQPLSSGAITLNTSLPQFDTSSVTFNYTPQDGPSRFHNYFSNVISLYNNGLGFIILYAEVTKTGIGYSSGSYRIGNMVYASSERIPPVPEPDTWALLIVGFGALGIVLRHKSTMRRHQSLKRISLRDAATN